jgi:hypothetical protein
MPQGPGTYGSKKGRPSKKKVARGSTSQTRSAEAQVQSHQFAEQYAPMFHTLVTSLKEAAGWPNPNEPMEKEPSKLVKLRTKVISTLPAKAKATGKKVVSRVKKAIGLGDAYIPMYDVVLKNLNEKKKTKKKKDDKWMQKADKSIERRGTEGKCTPMTKPGCTGKALALAKTFHKIAAKRKGK